MLLEMVLVVDQNVLDLVCESDLIKCGLIECVLKYMGLWLNQVIIDIQLDWVFIGFCINLWIEDLCVVVEVVRGCKVVVIIKQVLVVLGFGLVKEQVEKEGLDWIFIEVGFEWCELGCFMCLVMNLDWLESGEYCVLIFNCNFEGCQGVGGCIYLVSLVMVVVVVVNGCFIDVCELFV